MPLLAALVLLATTDEYAVYSAALAKIEFSHASHNQKLVILRDTLDPRKLPVPNESCWKLSKESRRRVDEVLAAHSISESRTLADKKLAIARPYVLITQQQADEWQERLWPKIPTDPPSDARSNPFPEASDLIRVSSILFNANKTAGLVYISAMCGPLCGLSQWYLVEKNQGVWHVFSTPGCGTIS